MEDAAVEFLLENLKQLQLHHAHLISNETKNQIQVLESNLCLFKRLLNDSTGQNRDEDETLKQVIKQIVEVVYEAEDAVDAVVSQATEQGLKKYFKRGFDAPENLLSVVPKVELIGTKVKEIYDLKQIDFSTLHIKCQSNYTEHNNRRGLEVSGVGKDNVVGFEGDVQTLTYYLTETTKELDVISIVGIAGLGKTTVARRIFHDWQIAYEFPIRIWVYISKDFRKKDVYLSILRGLNSITDNLSDKTDGEIAQTLRARLEREKFLIVFDDLWSTEAWDDLRVVLPKTNRMSKILITSRVREVVTYANPNREPYILPFLDYDKSWLLLRLAVFGEKLDCPSNLKYFGKSIARLCGGLPLQILLIGGVLAKTVSGSETYETWEKVYKGLKACVEVENIRENYVSFCYNMLPYYLRPCFIYMGMFPEDFQIQVQNLILLWIAEGFIQQKRETIELEETAMEYFEELIDRNLVLIDQQGLTGRIKTCRVHDSIRDFCLSKAKEYFFQEIQDISKPWTSEQHKYRHILVNSQVVSFISSEPYGPRVRTFLHFSREETILLPENVSFISDSFKLLRVLDVKPIRFTRFPFYLTQLIHFRYITLSSDFKVIPEAISKMRNIQTLIVCTSSCTLEIKADIWKMNQLRHLETNASIILQENTTREGFDDKCEKIQTLSNISPKSCTQVFERATDLKKLGIRGRLAMLMDQDVDGSSPFDGLRNLHLLEKLKLLDDVFAGESRLPSLPPHNKFPLKLMSLTLSFTLLDWKNMCILGKLENLKVLKLKNKAFRGECWEAADNGFRQLEVLLIKDTNLVVWKASDKHFPKLKYLALRNCEKLQALPLGLAAIPSLQVIDLYRTTKSAVATAKKIEALTNGRQLELSIFPRDE